MRKLNTFSLKITVVLGVLFLSFGVLPIAAQLPDCKLLALTTELPCRKWTFQRANSQTPTEYLSLFPNNCDNSYGGLTCYWSSAVSACKALVIDWNKYHPNLQATYVKVLQTSPDPNALTCYYKIQGISGREQDTVWRENVSFFPHQSHCDMEINGPYRNCSDQFTFCGTSFSEAKRGLNFTTTQRNRIKKTNKDNNNGKLKSDLAGFSYPKPANENCVKADPNNPQMCIEPDFLEQTAHPKDKAEVHHVVPKKDRQGCNCGKNSMKNAAVISKQLNLYLLNFPRPQAEINMINTAGQNPYPCSSNIIRPPKPLRKKPQKKIKK